MRSLDELQKLAEQGHDESQFIVGYMYASGKGAPKDIARAKIWLEKAATANNPRAQYYLGEVYGEMGKSDPKYAYKQMAHWWGKSATHPYWETAEGYDGRAISMRRLAWLQMHSGYDAANPEDALRLLETLTTKFSSPRSAIELGIVYSAGSFMPLSKKLGDTPIQQDRVKGIRLIERGILIIENGSNDIDYNLYSAIGDTYLMRDGETPIAAEALHKGIIYKKKALNRAAGVNEIAASNLRNQIADLEKGPAPTVQPIQRPATIGSPVETIKEATPPLQNSELAAKFEKFGEYFDGLEIEDKRDFIKNLDQKLQENPNPDYNTFLLQCIEKYNAANQEIRTQGYQSAHNHFGGESDGQMAGAFQDAHPDAIQPLSTYHAEDSGPQEYSVHDDYDDTPVDHPLGNYTDRIHSFGASSPFMFGSVLYTIGSLLLPIILGIYINHRFGFLGFAAILITAPPVAALWLIYMAAKRPKPPEKTLTALTLFRITFFLHLIIIGVGAAGIAIRFGMDGQAFFGLSIFDSPLDLVLILVSLAVVVLYVTFYYGSLFTTLKGIRENIYTNAFEPLPGIGPFSGIHNIMGVVIIVGSLGIIAVGLTPIDFVSIPEIITQWLDNPYFALALIAVSLILSRIGGLICTNVLKQFISGVDEYELEEEEYS